MKNINEVKSNWQEVKDKLKKKFAMLTDSDMPFIFIEGKKEETLRRLQDKLGKTKEEIYKIISEL